MDRFDLAVLKQLKTMDELLNLQAEIERCQKVEKQLLQLQEEEAKLQKLKADIAKLKDDLASIQSVFETQTEEAIRSYHMQESL